MAACNYWPPKNDFTVFGKFLNIKSKMALRTFTYYIYYGPEAVPGRPSVYQALKREYLFTVDKIYGRLIESTTTS